MYTYYNCWCLHLWLNFCSLPSFALWSCNVSFCYWYNDLAAMVHSTLTLFICDLITAYLNIILLYITPLYLCSWCAVFKLTTWYSLSRFSCKVLFGFILLSSWFTGVAALDPPPLMRLIYLPRIPLRLVVKASQRVSHFTRSYLRTNHHYSLCDCVSWRWHLFRLCIIRWLLPLILYNQITNRFIFVTVTVLSSRH